MSLSLVSVEKEPITKALAKKYRDMTPLVNERPLKSSRAKEHVKLIQTGRFFCPLWGCCRFNGVTYRGNGNHTSNVLLACMTAHEGMDERSEEFVRRFLLTRGGAWKGEKLEDLPEVAEGEFTAIVETFDATEQADLVTFFKRYDSSVSARSPQDVLGIYIGEQDSLRELSRDKVRYALNGVLPAARKDKAGFGLPDSEPLETYRGDTLGHALRVNQIAKAVRWLVETVPDVQLYKNPVGAQVCAEVYSTYGESHGEKIISTMVNNIENDIDPAASFEMALNKRHNKPTPESLLKKGRTAVKEIAKAIA